MHAEENALLEAGRGSVVYDNGVVLYCNTCPCLGCAIKIIQQGVKEVVYSLSYGMDQMTAKVFKEAKVKLRQHSPPSMRIELRDTLIEDQISLLELK
jgi:dCMP deaminase